MSGFATALTAGIIAFAATNIDDIVILLVFFSQVDTNFRRRDIFVGQYLGFTVIVLVSLPSFLGGFVVSSEWMGLLGLLPIVIGIKQLVQQEDTTQVQTVTSDFKPSSPSNPIVAFLSSVLNSQTYKVAAVTVANGGDNISKLIGI